jgi:CHAD domain
MARARPVAGLRPRATLLENARAIIAVRVAEMFSFADAIGDPARDEDLHNMRIAAKRLRYTLEMFRVCLGPDGPALIDSVKEIQDRIGVIHDADVLVEVVRLRLAVAAHRQVEALTAATAAGDERQRVEHVRAAIATSDDPRLGLALLMARTRAERERNTAALTAWWAEHGGDALRARLDASLRDARTLPALTGKMMGKREQAEE